MTWDLTNPDVDPNWIYYDYATTLVQPSTTTIVGGEVSPVTTINGNSGQAATGPTITITGGSTGYNFVGSGNSIALTVGNAATVRSSISAAQSGANGDITSLTALTGNTGFAAWSGTADKTTHATYPTTTASAGYVQAEMQGLMDKMKQITEAFKAVEDALLAWGGLET